MDSSRRPASGTNYTLTSGTATAVVATLAGALRSYAVDGVQLTETWGEDSIPAGGAGILLAPWANRVGGAVWRLDGAEQRLDITEPAKGNASHGLLRNTGYAAETVSDTSVVLSAEIFPQHGYPFHLTHTAAYELGEAGLTVTQSLTNHSAARAPFGLGAHPYLKISDVPTEDLTLTVQAGSVFDTDERSIPVGRVPVTGDRDLRGGRRIGDIEFDAAFTDLTAVDGSVQGSEAGSGDGAGAGRYEHTLAAPDGRSVTLWADPEFSYVHVFISTTYPGVARAVAVEPMTAPADAFNSGEGLRWLEPGSTFCASWGIRPRLA